MLFSLFATGLVSALVVQAANVTILVGDGGSLAFTPPQATAQIGDIITFEFRAKNHSVTQSTFANPCQQMTTPVLGIDSGFQAIAANATAFPQWSFELNNASAPLWFFCAQTVPAVHCEKGMVFALNPTTVKTFEAFQANAMGNATASSGDAPPSAASGSPSGFVTQAAPTPTIGAPFSIPPAGATSGAATNASTGTGTNASDTTNIAKATIQMGSAGTILTTMVFCALLL